MLLLRNSVDSEADVMRHVGCVIVDTKAGMSLEWDSHCWNELRMGLALLRLVQRDNERDPESHLRAMREAGKGCCCCVGCVVSWSLLRQKWMCDETCRICDESCLS